MGSTPFCGVQVQAEIKDQGTSFKELKHFLLTTNVGELSQLNVAFKLNIKNAL